MTKPTFEHELVKGRIVETLFAQMLRETKNFTVLAFGYENVLPELTSRQRQIQAEDTMEIIRRAPDFVVINNKLHEVYLVEVKYRMHQRAEEILRQAERICTSWKPAYLFLATPEGFFFDKAIDIAKNKGKVKPFQSENVSSALQEKYKKLLNEFIVSNKK